MSLIQRLTTIRTLLMNICDAWTASRRWFPKAVAS